MTVRKATEKDLDVIMKIYAKAREYMRRTGNETQWNGGYPSAELIQSDIKKGQSFVEVGNDGNMHGVFAFILGEDPTYRIIENGAWKNDLPYGTIHRIAGDGTERGVFATAFSYCLEKTGNIRADTHRNNLTMQHVLEKHGFLKCGIIYVEDGTERIAYQYCRTGEEK
jgi:hypothetical protein